MAMIAEKDETIQQLVENLKQMNPYKVILFGSYAWGTPNKDSDIDLLVVTNDEFMPQSYHEKSAIFLNVANCIEEIEKKMPIDLIVHTKAMFERFVDLKGMFARRILTKGIHLI